MSTGAKIGIAVGATAVIGLLAYLAFKPGTAGPGPVQIVPQTAPGGNSLATIASTAKQIASAGQGILGLAHSLGIGGSGDSTGDSSGDDGESP